MRPASNQIIEFKADLQHLVLKRKHLRISGSKLIHFSLFPYIVARCRCILFAVFLCSYVQCRYHGTSLTKKCLTIFDHDVFFPFQSLILSSSKLSGPTLSILLHFLVLAVLNPILPSPTIFQSYSLQVLFYSELSIDLYTFYIFLNLLVLYTF